MVVEAGLHGNDYISDRSRRLAQAQQNRGDGWLLPQTVMVMCVGVAVLLLLPKRWPERLMAHAMNQEIQSADRPRESSEPPMAIAPRESISYFFQIHTPRTTRLVVDLSDRHVTVFDQDQPVQVYDIAIGQPGWETPIGEFTITRMVEHPLWQHPITHTVIEPGADNPLGTRWIGFTEINTTLIGFHGTNQPDLIGQAVSHGCIRMTNEDVEAMYALVQLGATVVVQP